MSDNTQIEWADATWNCLLGCDKISPGCANCYAVLTCWRLQHNPDPKIAAQYAGLVEKLPNGKLNWTGRINLIEERLIQPLQWRKPRRVFVNSQSDLFHEKVPDEFIDRIFAVMACAPQHTFQILTKRPERMLAYLTRDRVCLRILMAAASFIPVETMRASGPSPWPLPNVWLGVSVEDQKTADSRIPALKKTPAALWWLSIEPQIGPVDLMKLYPDADDSWISSVALSATLLGGQRLRGVDWVVVGGESGAGARPMHPNWARQLRDQCQAAGVAFFFKQWGEWLPIEHRDQADGDIILDPRTGRIRNVAYPSMLDAVMRRVGKKNAGRLLDGREWNEFPTA